MEMLETLPKLPLLLRSLYVNWKVCLSLGIRGEGKYKRVKMTSFGDSKAITRSV